MNKIIKQWVCVECHGDGTEYRIIDSVCFFCRGTGFVTMSTTSVCDVCKGKGIVPLHTFGPCSYCRGTGYGSWVDYIKRPSKKEKELPCFV